LDKHKERSWVKNGREIGKVGNPHNGEILSKICGRKFLLSNRKFFV
jgi:hypothetical protein